jgi:hypothetical protein
MQELQVIIRELLVECARTELEEQALKANVSRISAMTGLTRRDVDRLMYDESPKAEPEDLFTKIIGTWRSDPKFTTSAGRPRVLTCDTLDSEFASLVASVSQDLSPGTVMFELTRLEAIERTKTGVRLLVQSYAPYQDPIQTFNLLSKDVGDLVDGVTENVFDRQENPNLHARTNYDRIRLDALPEIRRWALAEGHSFHAKVREVVSQHDQDINPQPGYKGGFASVTVGAFSYVRKSEK